MADKPRRLGSQPIEQPYRKKMNELASFLDHEFNGNAKKGERTTGFVMLVFKFGEGGRANYISNAEREDVVTLLKEQLAYFQGAPEDVSGNA